MENLLGLLNDICEQQKRELVYISNLVEILYNKGFLSGKDLDDILHKNPYEDEENNDG